MNTLAALSQINDEEVIALIAEPLHDDPDRPVQKQAIRSLGDSHNPRAAVILEPIAADRNDRELSMLAREAMKLLEA